MKVSLNDKFRAIKQTNFTGFNIKKDEYGEKYYEWSYPYDPQRYDCYLELYSVVPDKNGDYDTNGFTKIKNPRNKSEAIQLKPGLNKIDLAYDFRIPENAPFAYHYSLVPKANKDALPIYKIDAGDILDKRVPGDGEKIFNLVIPISSGATEAGAAILICADNYDPRFIYDKNGKIIPNPNAESSLGVFKNFANHVGGTLAGVEHSLDEGGLDVYNRIFLLPHTSGDRTSAAGYWLESGFQFSSAVDNVDTFTKLQRKLFAKGKTIVADSAFTSEGMSGIHIQSILKNGEDDVFFDWFKCGSLKDMTAKIGAFGKKNKYIRHKLINAPFDTVQNTDGKVRLVPNKKYNKDEPTYVQVYNIDQASQDQILDNMHKIDKYGKPNGSNPLTYGTHNDTLIAYSFPIDPKVYEENVKRFNEFNRRLPNGQFISINSYEATRILTKFERFEFENKIEGGFYTWDANVDIAKFDYTFSNEDAEEAMHLLPDKRKEFFDKKAQKQSEVLDYAVSSLKYWTKKTNQILNLYVAQTLKGIDTQNADKALKLINEKISKKYLPEKLSYNINRSVVDNVLKEDYILHGAESFYNFQESILNGIMSYPLESTEVGKDILALFSTPYITNRATSPKDIGKSRFELLRSKNPHLTPQYEKIYNQTTAMYTGAMYKFSRDVIDKINDKLPKDLKLNRNDDTSSYGKYVLPIITQEIAKFAVVRGLFPDVKYTMNRETGGISYDYDALRSKSLKSLHIIGASQRDEAQELVSKLNSGIKRISENDKNNLAEAVYRMIDGTNLKSFEMAEMIVDRTKGGIDWRIDAAKDFSNMDSLRNLDDTFEDNWDRVIDIIGTLAEKGIRKENPNAYIVAEVTDEVDLHSLGAGEDSERFVYKKGKNENGVYEYRNDLVRKLLREAKVDAVANYSHYFTDIGQIFGKRGEDGNDYGENQDYRMNNVFRRGEGGEEFLYSGPYSSILNSYTFVDNHDKPRILHILSLDMGLFYANLNDPEKFDYRKRAFIVLNPNTPPTNEAVNNYDYSYVSSKAVARGEALNSAFYKAIESLVDSGRKDSKGKFVIMPADKEKIFNQIKDIVSVLAGGEYKGVDFEADNFGVEEVHKLIKIVIDELARISPGLINGRKEQLFAETFEKSIDPALNNSLGMDKFLINAPGIPTTYAGDDLGSTGYETKTKNTFLKNRSAVHHEWYNKYPFIKKRKDEKDQVKLMRSRPVLHALNDGAPFLLKEQHGSGQNVTALFRYAPDGNAVLSLFNTAGTTHTFDKYSDPYNNPVYLDGNKIDLSVQDDFTGLHAGLRPGMEFINANDPDDKYYVFNKGGDDNYYLAKDENCSTPIVLRDNTLTLYHASDWLKGLDHKFLNKVKKAKEDHTSFCGSKIFVNKQYNIAPPKYNNAENVIKGEKLVLLSE